MVNLTSGLILRAGGNVESGKWKVEKSLAVGNIERRLGEA